MESKNFLHEKYIGEKIRFYRKKRGMSQVSLAKLLEITPQQLQKYEKGKDRIRVSKLLKVAEILSVNMNHFLKNQGNRNPDNSDSDLAKLVSNFEMINSDKAKKILVDSSEVFAESGI